MGLTVETKNSKEESGNTSGKEYTQKKPFLKYGTDTLISAATNRPVKEGAVGIKPHLFWCEVCKVKLTNPMSAISHFSGKHHLGNAKNYVQKTESLKRKLTQAKSGPAAKVTKNMRSTPSGGAARDSNSTNKRGSNNRGAYNNRGYNRNNYSNTRPESVSNHFGMQYQSSPGTSFGSQQSRSGNTFGFSQQQSLPFSNNQSHYGSLGGGFQGNNQQAYDMLPNGGYRSQSRGNVWRY